MNFDLTEEQILLQNSIARYVESRRDHEADPRGHAAANWAFFAELGLLGLPIPETAGGFGGGPIETMVMMEALGHGLASGGILDEIVVGAGLLAEAGGDATEQWIEAIVRGERHVVLAHAERLGRYDWEPRETQVTGSARGLQIDGEKPFVAHGGRADAYIVPALDSEGGTGLYLLPIERAGVSRRTYRSVDASESCALRLDGVVIEDGDRLDGSNEILETVITRSIVAASAEMLGIMTRLFDETLAYVQTRRQFDAAIGSFQVVQHRMARLWILIEQSRSALLRAVLTPEAQRTAWLRAAAGSKAFIADAAIALAHECVQFHGGMGITDELIIGHGHKRLMVLARMFGDPGAWRLRYERLAA